MTDTPDPIPPIDRRPRPQYGELAPEGWTWQPPAAEVPAAPGADAASAVVSPTPAAPARPVGGGASPLGSTGAAGTSMVPTWDRPVTVSLLIFGLITTFFTVSGLSTLPDAMQMLYTQADLGTYKPEASVGALLVTGSISLALVWIAAAALSVRFLMRGRRAFYVPLVAGVLSTVLFFVFMAIVLTTDSTLLEVYGQP